MADLDFPTSPSDGDTYEGYVYNAAKGVWQWQTLSPSLVSLTDTDISSPSSGEVLEYDGTNWVNAAGAVGGLVAVKSALKTDAEVFTSVAAGGNVAVTDLSITHEVSDPANRLIISAFFGAAANSQGEGDCGLSVAEDGALLAIGDAAGSRTRLTAGGLSDQAGGNEVVSMPSVTFVHTPGAGEKTYTVRAVNMVSAVETLYVNRPEYDQDSASRQRAASSLVIQEVAV